MSFYLYFVPMIIDVIACFFWAKYLIHKQGYLALSDILVGVVLTFVPIVNVFFAFANTVTFLSNSDKIKFFRKSL